MNSTEKLLKISEEKNYDTSDFYVEVDVKTRKHFGVEEPIFLEDKYNEGDASIEALNATAISKGFNGDDEFDPYQLLLAAMDTYYDKLYDEAVDKLYESFFPEGDSEKI